LTFIPEKLNIAAAFIRAILSSNFFKISAFWLFDLGIKKIRGYPQTKIRLKSRISSAGLIFRKLPENLLSME
jgi:hypothetical protein